MPRILVLRSLILVILAVLMGTGSAFAQIATPGQADLPEASAPLGLGSVTLPDDEEGIEALFANLPNSVAGHHRNPLIRASDRILARYGPDDGMFGPTLVLGAISFERGDFFPAGFTPGDYVAMASQTDDTGATAFGRDGDLVWISTETTVGTGGDRPGTPAISEPLYTLAWGDIDGRWMFTAAASTPEGLDTLVTAFVATAQGQPATPIAPATPLAGILRR